MPPSNRFSRSNRLVRPSDYRRVFASGQQLSNRYFVMRVFVADQQTPKLGTAVSKKVVKTAVLRNHIKRIIRESFRHEQLNLAPCEFVITVKKAVLEAKNPELFDYLGRLWKESSELCAKS